MRKRVAHISVHECPLASSEGKERGGINVYTYELSKALSDIGWQSDVYTRIQDDINLRDVTVNDRFKVFHLPNGPHTPLTKKDILAHLSEFTNALAQRLHYFEPYDILHAHYYISGIVAQSVLKNSPSGIPVIMTFHTMGLLKQLVARGSGTEDPDDRISTERNLAKDAEIVITSSETGKVYLTSFYDCPKEKIRTIPPGVDTSLFKPMDQLSARTYIGQPASSFMILAVGRIDPVKGFDVLLAAVKILLRTHPEFTDKLCLCIVGGDVGQTKSQWSRELAKLNTLRSQLKLTTAVQFIPPLPQEKLPYYYNAADVVVMPSHYESFGMVALEAIACGTPVIATDVTGISDILRILPKGHIIGANNPIALATEIAHVLGAPHQPEAPLTISSLSWESIARRIAAVYEEAASS